MTPVVTPGRDDGWMSRRSLYHVPPPLPTGFWSGTYWDSAGPLWLEDAVSEALDHALLMIEMGPYRCVYCGDPATEADHLVPLPVTGPNLRYHVPTVPSCKPCNATLGAFPSPLVAGRATYIAHRIRLTTDYKHYAAAYMACTLTYEEYLEGSDTASRYDYAECGGVLRAVRKGQLPIPGVHHQAAIGV